jgi:hypothetical protein
LIDGSNSGYGVRYVSLLCSVPCIVDLRWSLVERHPLPWWFILSAEPGCAAEGVLPPADSSTSCVRAPCAAAACNLSPSICNRHAPHTSR